MVRKRRAVLAFQWRHVGNRRSLILICILLLFLSGERLEAAYGATINAVTFSGEDFILDADEDNGSALYNRDRIYLGADMLLTRLSSDPAVVNMRLAVQLLSSGQPVLLDNGSGGTTTTAIIPFTYDFETFTSRLIDRPFNVKPAVALDLEALYQVDVSVQVETSPGSGSYQEMDTGASGFRRFWHFTGKQDEGNNRNLLARIRTIQFDKPYAIQTGPNDRVRGFVATAEVEVRRYDGWTLPDPNINDVEFQLNGVLRDNSPDGIGQPGTLIPLETPALWDGTVTIAQYVREPDFNLPAPAVEVVQMELLLIPASQIATATETFLVEADLSHIKFANSGAYVDNVVGFSSTDATLYHFNGDLTSDVAGATAVIRTIDGNPSNPGTGSGYRSATIEILTGELKLSPNYEIFTLASPTQSNWPVDIRLFDNGEAVLQSGEVGIAAPTGQGAMTTAGNLVVERSKFRLVSTGLTADIALQLPEGMGVRVDSGGSSGFHSGQLTKTDYPLVPGFLVPVGPVIFNPPNGAHYVISEETKPFTVQANDLTWAILDGTLTPGPAPASEPRIRYVREAEVEALLTAPITPAERITRSNEAYYRFLDGTAPIEPVYRAAADGSALFDGTVAFSSGFFRSHFPYDVRLEWTGTGSIAFTGDIPQSAASGLNTPQAFSMTYDRDCLGQTNCGTIGPATIDVVPQGGDFSVTADGGLVTVVDVINGGELQLGYIDALSGGTPVFAHETSAFSIGALMTAGHFISGQGLAAPATQPEILLNSGFNGVDPMDAERPGEADYAAGSGNYPGLNLRVAAQTTGVTAQSVLGGQTSPVYDLGSRSKYYVRQAGVNGLHDPAANPFPDPVSIYGYTFEFTSFALAFLSSEVTDSRTSGSLYVPDPAEASNGFTVAFDPLFFSCIGALTHAELTNGPFDHTLSYWNADIRLLSAAFEPKAGAACDPGEAFFATGVQGHVSNIADPLFGTLVFAPDGDLVPGNDPDVPEGRDSRLIAPSTVFFDGPAGEQYALMMLQDAYLNRHAEAGSSFDATAEGFINLAGLLDVAFFRDLEVHIHTGARSGNTTDTLHLTGGWEDGGDSFFNSSAFDTGNRGYPPAANLSNYRESTDAQWEISAHQEWLDVINFNYVLDWDSASRSFRSREPVTNDLKVIETEHRLTRLSPDVAELDFGAGLDIQIPEVNLSGLAQSTPLYDALHDVASLATDELLSGLDASERLLNDFADSLLEAALSVTVDPLTDGIADAITDGAASAIDQAQLETILDDGFAAIESSMTSATGFGEDLATGVNGELQSVRQGIDAVAGPGGYFENTGTAENPQYNVASAITLAVLEKEDPALAGSLTTSLGAPALDDAVNASLSERSATIEQVKGTLSAVDSAIDVILTEGGMEAELVELFTGNPGSVSDMLSAARSQVDAAIDAETLGEWTGDQINDLLREAIRDQLNASPLIADLHEILRGYVYELDATMRSAIDSAFAEVNQVIIDLVDDFLPVDGPLRAFLGDLAGSTAVGQLDGYARINGDALRTLRIDAEFETNFPDPFAFNGYIEINQLDSSDAGSSSCFLGTPNEILTEVLLGAENVKVGWMGRELRFDIDTKFSFDPAAATRLVGMAGAFEMTDGSINFEAFKIDQLAAGAAFSLTEHYLAAKVGLLFNGDRMAGGVFLGKTCSLDPIFLVDPDVANVLPEPNPTFTGIYAYGQAFIPIVNVGCLFSLSANAGAGIFMFYEDDTYGGKMLVGASARAICAVNVGGEISLVGVKHGNQFNFSGKGRIYGSVGKKPLKVSFDERVILTYKNSKWDYDY